MRKMFFAACAAAMLSGCSGGNTTPDNPFFTEWDTPFGVPPFEQIKPEHYKPAFMQGMEEQKAEVEAIVNNADDATEFGDDASNSYWEADSAEAICGGFYGTDPEAMGKHIADLIRNSSGHWSYISSSEYKYMGVGVEYREGTEYGWYACVMVGSVNYG